jgi:hypothetical protein
VFEELEPAHQRTSMLPILVIVALPGGVEDLPTGVGRTLTHAFSVLNTVLKTAV